MRYAQIRQYDVANGKGIGCTLFVSGCTHNCPSCFNKEYQDFNYGNEWTFEIENQFIEMCKSPHVDHINLLGGEPFQQDIQMYYLLLSLYRNVDKPVWVWTGCTWDEIVKTYRACWLNFIDVLIDGRFVESQKDLTLHYRGSKNQRVINVQESLKQDKIVLWED